MLVKCITDYRMRQPFNDPFGNCLAIGLRVRVVASIVGIEGANICMKY